MRPSLFLAIAFLTYAGCNQPQPATPSPVSIQPYQRFVPVPSPQAQMIGVPWTGYFALDTQVGQLCLTTGVYIPEKFSKLPTCEEDFKTYPTPGQPSASGH
jgi:hypothetical protein